MRGGVNTLELHVGAHDNRRRPCVHAIGAAPLLHPLHDHDFVCEEKRQSGALAWLGACVAPAFEIPTKPARAALRSCQSMFGDGQVTQGQSMVMKPNARKVNGIGVPCTCRRVGGLRRRTERGP